MCAVLPSLNYGAASTPKHCVRNCARELRITGTRELIASPRRNVLLKPGPYGRGTGVGRGLGVGVDLGTTVAVGVAVATGVAVAVGVGLGPQGLTRQWKISMSAAGVLGS